MATLLSLGLAAASFILTMLILPSFWTDLEQVKNISASIKSVLNVVGTTFALVLIVGGAALTILSLRYRSQIVKIMSRSLVRLKRTFERSK
jgi:hypothetical protein